MEAVLLMGGQAARLRPLTESMPKALVPIANFPYIEWVIEYLVANGIDHVGVAAGYLHNALERALKGLRDTVNLDLAVEREPLDTAGAVRNAWPFLLHENFFVLNGDIVTTIPLADLMEQHLKHRAWVTIALVPVEDPSKFGAVVVGEQGKVLQFLEKPAKGRAPSNLVNAGIYVFNGNTLQYIPPASAYSIEKQLYPDLLQKGLPVFAKVFPNSYWADVGTPDSCIRCNFDVIQQRIFPLKARESRPGIWVADSAQIRSSVSLMPPVLIGDNCLVAQESQVGPFAVLGPNCRIDPGVTVRRSVLLENCVVGARAKVESCVLGTGCVVQPGSTTPKPVYGCGELVSTKEVANLA
ncbi:MAG: sugar phosphate nucleotidyltransferase [Bacillota bacterium]